MSETKFTPGPWEFQSFSFGSPDAPIRGRPIFIGGFDDPVEAVKARDAKALELFGQFAQLNFPKVTK